MPRRDRRSGTGRVRLGYTDAVPPAGGGGGAGEVGLAGSVLSALRLLSGRILTVFGARAAGQPLTLHTTTATIGIRGTGVYLESEPERSYVCTCYGSTLPGAVSDPSSRGAIDSSQHDAPRFILGAGLSGKRITPTPVFNHHRRGTGVAGDTGGAQATLLAARRWLLGNPARSNHRSTAGGGRR